MYSAEYAERTARHETLSYIDQGLRARLRATMRAIGGFRGFRGCCAETVTPQFSAWLPWRTLSFVQYQVLSAVRVHLSSGTRRQWPATGLRRSSTAAIAATSTNGGIESSLSSAKAVSRPSRLCLVLRFFQLTVCSGLAPAGLQVRGGLTRGSSRSASICVRSLVVTVYM